MVCVSADDTLCDPCMKMKPNCCFCGLEGKDDLIADIAQALEAVK